MAACHENHVTEIVQTKTGIFIGISFRLFSGNRPVDRGVCAFLKKRCYLATDVAFEFAVSERRGKSFTRMIDNICV